MKTRRSRPRGFATLIVMILTGLMTTYVVMNSRTLTGLKRSLQTIEQKQLRKFNRPLPPIERPSR
jgi:wyosine [tRNA(Phe)-imidazoG37] synthetase (radical SAM superfamily)